MRNISCTNLNLFYGKNVDELNVANLLQTLRNNFKFNEYLLISEFDYLNKDRKDYRMNRCNLVYDDDSKQISKIIWN